MKKAEPGTIGRRMLITAILLVCHYTLGLQAGRVQASAAQDRAMWVWGSARPLIADKGQWDAFLAFCGAPKGEPANRIARLFVWAVPLAGGDDGEKAALKSFIAECHARGIRVDMLDGDPGWALPEGADGLDTLAETFASWQRGNPPASRFDGLQLDIEPYLLPGWPNKLLMDGWVAAATKAKAAIGAADLGLAIPVWLDQKQFGNLNKPLQGASDYVALMDYRDTAASIVADALGELRTAEALGKGVYVGVETQDVRGDPPSVTFYQEGNARMEAELAKARAKLEGYGAFNGFAIHHLDSYRAMKP